MTVKELIGYLSRNYKEECLVCALIVDEDMVREAANDAGHHLSSEQMKRAFVVLEENQDYGSGFGAQDVMDAVLSVLPPDPDDNDDDGGDEDYGAGL